MPDLEPPSSRLEPPRLEPATGFTRELTPIWLATAALLAGQRPPDLAGPLHYAHLGCGRGETAAVVAAVHPGSRVWAWDWRPEQLETTSRLRDSAGLDNLTVHERQQPPSDLGDGPIDVVIVQEVLSAVPDERRDEIVAAIRTSVRPGALVCVTTPTVAGWAEIAPVQALLREVALQHRGPREQLVPEVLDLLRRLRAGGARYLTARPIVAAWLDHIEALDPEELLERYMRDPFRPMSPAHVAGLLADTGCVYLGSARLTDDLDLDIPEPLAASLAAVSDPIVRATYRDLAARRTHRMDVFRCGTSPLSDGERTARVAELPLAGLGDPDEQVTEQIDPAIWQRLHRETIAAGELDPDPRVVERLVRQHLDAGQIHPVLIGQGQPAEAVAACDALADALAATPHPDRKELALRPLAHLGSAVALTPGMVPRWAGQSSKPWR